jgi:hypothetical protein
MGTSAGPPHRQRNFGLANEETLGMVKPTLPSRRRLRRRLLATSIAVAASLALTAAGGPRVAATASTLGIRVSGNHLVNASGATVTLHGVDRSGTEYACVQGWGIFDGPSNAASVAAMASWTGVNAVRVPLNEDCWLGINGVPAAYSGAPYQAAIENYVALLHQYGLYAILDLHWTAPGTSPANTQVDLPDYDHSPAMWASVAAAFKGDPATIFDIFNEPNDVDMTGCATGAPAACTTYIQEGVAAANWWCWEQGTGCITDDNSSTFGDWRVASAPDLISAIRGAGASNVIMVGGEQYANDPSQWLAGVPTDPDGQLAMSFHVYNFNDVCVTLSCWDSELVPIAAQYPIITGEIGESDGTASFIDTYMSWADSHGVSYLAWTWDTWGCGDTPVLISDYSGTACPGFGAGYEAHLAALSLPAPTTGGYTVDAYGGLHAYGNAPYEVVSADYPGWNIVRGVVLDACDPTGNSGWTVDGYGGMHPFGAAPYVSVYGGYYPGWDIIRGAVAWCDQGHAVGYTVDAYGGMHPFSDDPGGVEPPYPQITGYWPGQDLTAGIALIPGTDEGYVVDAYGGLHPFNGAPYYNVSAYYPGFDIVRGVTLLPGGGGGYTVDAYGGLHPFGAAPYEPVSGYYAGSDIIRGVVAASASGGYTLDAFGGLHQYGSAPYLAVSGYYPGQEIVEAVVFCPS